MTDKKTSFYIVWCPSSRSPPKYRHAYLHDAEREAARLAGSNPQLEFFVMETRLVACARHPVDIELFETGDSDGIPF